MMRKTPRPELHLSIWQFNLIAKGKEAVQTALWPLIILSAAAAYSAYCFTMLCSVGASKAHLLLHVIIRFLRAT